MTPREYFELFKRIFVTCAVEGTPDIMRFDLKGPVKIRKYLMADYGKVNDRRVPQGEFERNHYNAWARLLSWNRRRRYFRRAGDRTALRKAFHGKGRPPDYEFALEVACLAGKCSATTPSLQEYADDHLGVDCSGFVNGYFQTVGQLPGRAYYTISEYARRGRMRSEASQARERDLLILLKSNGQVKTGPGHIVLVDHVASPPDTSGGSVGAVLRTYESTGGGFGLWEGAYEVERRVERNRQVRFYIKRVGTDGRVKRPARSWFKLVEPAF